MSRSVSASACLTRASSAFDRLPIGEVPSVCRTAAPFSSTGPWPEADIPSRSLRTIRVMSLPTGQTSVQRPQSVQLS